MTRLLRVAVWCAAVAGAWLWWQAESAALGRWGGWT